MYAQQKEIIRAVGDSFNDQHRTETNAVIRGASNIKAEETINIYFNTRKRDAKDLMNCQIRSSLTMTIPINCLRKS